MTSKTPNFNGSGVSVADLLGDQIVTVLVGDTSIAKNNVLHKELVSHHSRFFKAALEGPFLEGQTKSVELKEERPEVFSGFVHWLYTSQSPPEGLIGATESRSERALHFLHLYCLADRMFCPELKSLAYEAVRANLGTKSRPCPKFIYDLYTQTVPRDQFRLYVVEVCTYHALHSPYDSAWKETLLVDEDFATEFGMRLYEGVGLLAKDTTYSHPFYDKEYESLAKKGLKEKKTKATDKPKHKAKDTDKVSKQRPELQPQSRARDSDSIRSLIPEASSL